MNQKQIVNAYFTLNRLGTAQLPIKTAFDLFRLRKQLEPTCHFCVDQEQAIIQRYNGSVNDNLISFADPTLAKQAQSDLEELHSMEVTIENIPITIQSADLANAMMSMNEVESLDGFIVLI